jgi:Asp-tRNA(Asn)/Glu-tRNA(Gln) amidotransferase A subunit family amidase
MPIGLQLVGNEMQEALLLQIADAHQKATGFQLQRPGHRA